MKDYRNYLYKPLILDAATAHKNKIIEYTEDGRVILKDKQTFSIDPSSQFPMIFPAFMDLSKSLSRISNSPLLSDGKSLRDKFDLEFNQYRAMVSEAQKQGHFEPDYGRYMYDYVSGKLYLILPEYWHRIALVTSPSKLLTDKEKKLSWSDIRNIFDNAMIGVAGASVGGNVLEGVLREIRPKRIKIADPDYWEITNLSRAERVSLRHMVQSRSHRKDFKNPYEILRVNKADSVAYEQHLIDPYLLIWAYNEGIRTDLIDQFLLGDNSNEPKLDILIEEVDDISLKYDLREACKKNKIPLLMLSDFGHRVEVQFHDYRKPDQKFGYKVKDAELKSILDSALTSGNREDLFQFVRALCGDDFASDEFADWVQGRGEQPTSSLPQSGATALLSGGIGGKITALFLLGYTIPERLIFDFKNWKVMEG